MRLLSDLVFLVGVQLDAPWFKTVHVTDASDAGYAVLFCRATRAELQQASRWRER